MRTGTVFLAAVALGACAFDTSGIDVGDPPSGDEPPVPDDPGDPPVPDVPKNCPGENLAVVPSTVDRCAIPVPAGNLSLGRGAWTLDTTALTLVSADGARVTLGAAAVAQVGGPELAVVAATKIFVSKDAAVRVVGARPLVLVSFSDAKIEGVIDASAAGNAAGGGSGDAAACAGQTGGTGVEQVSTANRAGGSGGGGGAFGTAGGQGATVDNPAAGGVATGGGAPGGIADIVPLRGGCAGGTGGRGGGPGGGGGGAIQIVASLDVEVKGAISVAGGGGAGSVDPSGGGGGGGSGGGILLESAKVVIAGKLTANGGAGGEGRLAGDGTDRGDDGSRDSGTPALGGDSGVFQFGGNGGNGAAGAAAAADGKTGTGNIFDASGGGGGGGGAGRIHLRGDVQIARNAVLSPTPQ